MPEEFFDLIDDKTGEVTGRAARKECHGNPKLIHRSVRVVIYHPDGDKILLQKRSMSKDLFPGRWDMAVGGHVISGETVHEAVIREMNEELGVPKDLPVREIYTIKVRNEFESENVQAYAVTYGGPFSIQQEELDGIRFFPFAELRRMIRENPDCMTPLLVRELTQMLKV